MLRFYEQIIVVSYEKGLPTFYSEDKIKDKDFYPELRELYQSLKKGRTKSRRDKIKQMYQSIKNRIKINRHEEK
jgi:hypothetical protein